MQNKRIISTANMVQKISEEFNITLKDSKLIVNFLFDYLLTTLYEDGKDVIITGKVKFHVYPVQAYKIINKITTNKKGEIRVPVQYRVTLKRSKYFKEGGKK
jgi:nucleoid DNA-binding protein